MARDIPVRLVRFREADDQAKRYNIGDSEPQFVLHGEDLKEHVKKLKANFEALTSEVKRHLNTMSSVSPAVISINLNPKATAKSYRGDVSSILSSDDGNDIVGVRGCEELLVSIGSGKHLDAIGARLWPDETRAYGLSAIGGMEVFRPNVCTISDSPDVSYKFRTIAFYDEGVDAAVHERVVAAMNEAGEGNPRYFDYAPHMRVYNIRGANASAVLGKLSLDGVLYSFEEMPTLRVVLDVAATESSILPKEKVAEREYPRLGILDSGIAKNVHLAPWIVGRNTHFLEDDRNVLHGSMVASVAIYGDSLEGVGHVGNNDGIEIIDGQVFPADFRRVTEFDLISNIGEVLEDWKDAARVWNISVGFDTPISKDRFSDLAVALDDFQRRYGVLIVKSAGNSLSYFSSGQHEQIHLGADSLMSMTVGSVAHKKNACDVAEVGEPSPFTCIGPGVESTIKPEVGHYGGNAGTSTSGSLLYTGVGTISPDGSWMEAPGTSFAAPRVSALAAILDYELGEKSSPLLLKALIVHSAKYPCASSATDVDILDKIGYGVPSNVSDVLHDAPDEATMVFQGTIRKSRVLEIKDFKMPQSLVSDGFYTGQILITLAINPILASTQGLEYCQSTVDVRMGTYDHSVDEIDRQGPLVKLIDRKNVLTQSNYTRNAKARVASFGQERALISNAGKYWPIKKYAVDLSEMTPTNRRKFLGVNRKWYLGLDASFRDWADRESARRGERPEIDYCLVVTVKDSARRGLVNAEIGRFLEQGNFAYDTIPIRSENRIVVRG